MRLFRSRAAVVVAALGTVVAASCGLPDAFRSPGLKGDVVIRFTGDSVLSTGQRVAPIVTVTAGGVVVPNPRLRFASSDPTILALTAIGDTLVACRAGHAQLNVWLISSMITDSAPTGSDSLHITGAPVPTCP